MEKTKVIIYDNDGMIIHGLRFSDRYIKEFGISQDIMSPFFNGPFKKCLTGNSDIKEELKKVLELWKWKGTEDELLKYWFDSGDEIYADVYESITKLKNQGLIVCLATNQEKYRNQYLIEKFSYSRIFNEIFCSAVLGYTKHSSEGLEKIFQMLHEKYGVNDKEEVMYWDDREENVENLKNVGFNGQKYIDYPSFKSKINEYGFTL